MHVATLLSLSLLTPCIVAQHLPRDTGSASGEVRCQDGNTPARGATIHLIPLALLLADPAAPSPPSLKSVETQTDFQGTFSVAHLAPGAYLLDAQLAGYTNSLDLVRTVLDRLSADQRRKLLSTFPSLTIAPGSEAHQNLLLSRGGSVDGTVSVDTGGLIGPANVVATLVASPLLGAIELAGKSTPLYTRQSPLDDLGRFHIAGLPPGQYRLSIRLTESFLTPLIHDTALLGFKTARTGTAALTVYAPSALSRTEAKVVSVRDGDHIADANITIPMRTLHTIHGTVLRQGNPVSGINILLRHPDQTLIDTHDDQTVPDAITDENGAFTFNLLPSGPYRMSAMLFKHDGNANTSARLAELPIDLGDTDLPDLILNLPISTPPIR